MWIIEKIDVSALIRAHHATLVSERDGRVLGRDRLLFYGFPLVSGVAFAFLVDLNTPALQTTVTALSIFSGLLLNMLVVMFNMAKEPERYKYPRDQGRLVQQSQANIAYCIIVGVGLIVLSVLLLVTDTRVGEGDNSVATGLYWLDLTLRAVLFTGLIHFVLSLIMVVKRVAELLRLHVQPPEPDGK
ncbi:hypothetical protein [Rubrivirga litoralis]|uniref:Uncharacterized protein n=1 Tax=Rubrivirga litoralis TaxID=3075598 RepID=A0ABU3BPV2_9BACT|nr:hypothetical protein [Rubrivirga sp. F394]MDT0631316.1 hypothetical protein [Rubrivirga sp. F394]